MQFVEKKENKKCRKHHYVLTLKYLSDISDIRKMEGYIFDIKKFAVHDGPGIRTTIFLSGCPLSCFWCHNPESRLPLDADNSNRMVTSEEILEEIRKDTALYDESEGGVTFSGGEPLFQFDFLFDLLKLSKKAGFHTAVDTSGYASSEKIETIVSVTDLFLYDIKILNSEKHKEFTGVDNKMILSNIKKLAELEKEIIVRIPLIPGYNDGDDDLKETAGFIKKIKGISHIDLLPYHRLGISKYKKLDLELKMKDIWPPDKEKIYKAKNLFEDFGFKVGIGG